jgi:hypothetical protein
MLAVESPSSAVDQSTEQPGEAVPYIRSTQAGGESASPVREPSDSAFEIRRVGRSGGSLGRL